MANECVVDELKLPLEPAESVKRANGSVTFYKHEICAKWDGAGLSHQSRVECLAVTGPLWPEHKIFLSHSGAQKAFTEHLCKELERVHHFPFFDRRPDSLRKGERFYAPMMTAAQTCRVSVLVLSEQFFTASKWPMMELNEFVKAQEVDKRVRILPLYFQISREELGERERQARWIEEWKVMESRDASIDVKEWEYALGQISGNNGMAYGGNTEGEAAFIHRVVEAVCRLLPPDVKWDVSNVRFMPELSEPILRKLKDVKQREDLHAQVVGLYGTEGAGKTTISRAICNEMFGDFVGKVCYIEFGKMEVEELLKLVLQELTEASPAILINKRRDQLLFLMKERINRQKVLLVLDNVLDLHISDAQMFLRVRYCDGSMVLVTSRSLGMLEAVGVRRGDCMEMPVLEEDLVQSRSFPASPLIMNHWHELQRHVAGRHDSHLQRPIKLIVFPEDYQQLAAAGNGAVYIISHPSTSPHTKVTLARTLQNDFTTCTSPLGHFRSTTPPFASATKLYLGVRTPAILVWTADLQFFCSLQSHRSGPRDWEYSFLKQSSTGSVLYCGCSDGAIEVWNRGQHPGHARVYERALTSGHAGRICNIAVGQDGTMVSVDTENANIVRIWRSLAEVAQLDLGREKVLRMVCTPNKNLYVATEARSKLWCDLKRVLALADPGSVFPGNRPTPRFGLEYFFSLQDPNRGLTSTVRSCLALGGGSETVCFLCYPTPSHDTFSVEEWRSGEFVSRVDTRLRMFESWTVSKRGTLYFTVKSIAH